MRTMARVATLLSLLWTASAGAADVYAIRGEIPETGSNIPRAAITWPIPINKRYEDLTGEQQRMVRDDYVSLSARDEPPYPRDGMMPILGEVARIQAKGKGSGLLHLAVRVDSRGQPQDVAVLRSPDHAISQAVSYVLMRSAYKPAKCDGAPCASDFSFKYYLDPIRYHNPIVDDWNPIFWMIPLNPS
jgi:hypothetical protein